MSEEINDELEARYALDRARLRDVITNGIPGVERSTGTQLFEDPSPSLEMVAAQVEIQHIRLSLLEQHLGIVYDDGIIRGN